MGTSRYGVVIEDWVANQCSRGYGAIGSAFDSRSKGWEFESLWPHYFFQLLSFCSKGLPSYFKFKFFTNGDTNVVGK